MEISIDSIEFSEKERKYYSHEFDQITSEQKLPLSERELSLQSVTQFLKQLKIKESELATILDLISEKKTYLKLANFMACMRLCSALKQGKPLNRQTYLNEQNVLARKSRNPPTKPIATVGEPKPEEPKKLEEIKLETVAKIHEEAKPDLPSISLQVSQEVPVIKPKSFEEPKFSPEPVKSCLIGTDQNSQISKAEKPASDINKAEKPAFEEIGIHSEEKPVFPIIRREDILKGIPTLREYCEPKEKPPEVQPKAPIRSSFQPSHEERKKSPAKFPRVPSIPKIYKSPLTQIPEETTPLNSFSPKEPQIRVDTPILITSGWLGASSYHSYTITSRLSDKTFTVKRRFSDLDWMHTQLTAKYKGFIIPSRPEKKYIKNTDDKFIEDRRLQMEKYLNIIAKHPILSASAAFKAFTQTSSDKFEQEKSRAEAVEEYREYNSIEDAVDKVFALVQSKFQTIFTQRVPFNKEIVEVEEKLLRLEAPSQALAGNFAHWVQTQAESDKVVSGLKILPQFDSALAEFKALTRGQHKDLLKLSLELKEEQLRLEGLKEAVNSYKYTMEECSKLQTLISRKLSKHKSSSDEDTAARYLNEIQSTQELIEKYNKSLQEIEENILKEQSTFDQAKTDHLGQTISELISCQTSYYSQESAFWRECFKNIS